MVNACALQLNTGYDIRNLLTVFSEWNVILISDSESTDSCVPTACTVITSVLTCTLHHVDMCACVREEGSPIDSSKQSKQRKYTHNIAESELCGF